MSAGDPDELEIEENGQESAEESDLLETAARHFSDSAEISDSSDPSDTADGSDGSNASDTAKARRTATRCSLCGKKGSQSRPLIRADLMRPSLAVLVRREHPGWGGPGDSICAPDLNRFRSRYIENLVEEEHGHLTSLERDVLDHMRQEALISEDTNLEFEASLTFGERLADKVADFGGSWAFILSFGGFLFLWMGINAVILVHRPFDPYPFILLNLILSTIAALQAPVIMMSQKRQESKDRLRNEQDYRVNLKAELEIRILSERMEALVHNQWKRLLEIQEIQVDLLQELARQARRRKVVKVRKPSEEKALAP